MLLRANLIWGSVHLVPCERTAKVSEDRVAVARYLRTRAQTIVILLQSILSPSETSSSMPSCPTMPFYFTFVGERNERLDFLRTDWLNVPCSWLTALVNVFRSLYILGTFDEVQVVSPLRIRTFCLLKFV